MDPNANLARQRELARQIHAILDSEDGWLTNGQKGEIVDLANELSELVQGLDQWLSRGGFLPSDWNKR